MNWIVVLAIIGVLYLFLAHDHDEKGLPAIHTQRFTGYKFSQ